MHREPMLLVDKVVGWGDGEVEVQVDPASSSHFADARGHVPSWVGLEYMAQAISAYAGLVAWEKGEQPRLGFLLGTRSYQSSVDSFAPEQRLRVVARQILRDESNLVMFDCQIFSGERLLASAQVKAIQPDNPEDILKEIP